MSRRKPSNCNIQDGVNGVTVATTTLKNNGVSNSVVNIRPKFPVRFFLFVGILALFGVSAPGHIRRISSNSFADNDASNNAVSSRAASIPNARWNLRPVLDWVDDVMGYGPKLHPQVNVVKNVMRRHDKKKPSKPLRPENSKIVSHAKPINIEFVDASDGNKKHPHLGAMDENGRIGYIHDETALRKNPPSSKIDDSQNEHVLQI